MNLSRMLAPKSAVFVGGAELIPIIENTKKNQFSGEIFVISESEKSVEGVTCFPSVDDLPVDPDIAYLSLNDKLLAKALRELQRKDCGGAIINSDDCELKGTVELLNSEIEMPFLGGSSTGFANFLDGSIFLPDTAPRELDVESGIAVISHDKDYLSNSDLIGDSLPIAYSVGIGPEVGLSGADLLDYVLTDERVTAACVFLDSIRDVTQLSQAALKAARKGIPVVVVKVGRAAADDYLAVSALFDRLGFIECATHEEAIEVLKMLIFTGRPLGRDYALHSQSASLATLATDCARSERLRAKKLEPSISNFIRPFLTQSIAAANPLVLSANTSITEENLVELYQPFFADNFNLAVFVGSPTVDQHQYFETLLLTYARQANAQNIPCAYINHSNVPLPNKLRDELIKNNMAPLNGLTHGFKAIAKAVDFVDKMILMAQMPTGAIEVPEPTDMIGAIQLDEFDSKSILNQIGLTTPTMIFVEGTINLDLNELNYPVALKAVASNLTRKTDMGAVKLDLLTETQVRQAIFEMHALVESLDLRGYLVEEMVIDGLLELYVGIAFKPNIGHVLTLASGGVMVELLQDIQTLVLPASSYEIEAALRRLRLFPIIEGYRGKVGADVDKVVETIALLANHAVAKRDRLFLLEVNPLIIRPDGHYPVVVDASMQLGEKF
ncbi:MAG: acetate--CoA ligase family protein [Chloroflexota bacterium]